MNRHASQLLLLRRPIYPRVDPFRSCLRSVSTIALEAICCLGVLLACPAVASAALVEPPWVHVEASIGQPFVWEDTDEGSKTTAAVDSLGAVVGHHARNTVTTTYPTPERAVFTIDRQLTRSVATHPLGSNSMVRFQYQAAVDFTAEYSWHLEYTFPDGFSNGIIEGGTTSLVVHVSDGFGGWLQVHGQSMGPVAPSADDGVYEGSGTFDLTHGNTYRLTINNSGALFLGSPLSALVGNLTFTFDPVPIPGDLNGDGFVGITDLNIVLGNWNQTVPPGDPLADPSGDGFVGIEDLNTVLGNWNAGTPPGANANIPEPTTFGLLACTSIGLGIRSRLGG